MLTLDDIFGMYPAFCRILNDINPLTVAYLRMSCRDFNKRFVGCGLNVNRDDVSGEIVMFNVYWRHIYYLIENKLKWRYNLKNNVLCNHIQMVADILDNMPLSISKLDTFNQWEFFISIEMLKYLIEKYYMVPSKVMIKEILHHYRNERDSVIFIFKNSGLTPFETLYFAYIWESPSLIEIITDYCNFDETHVVDFITMLIDTLHEKRENLNLIKKLIKMDCIKFKEDMTTKIMKELMDAITDADIRDYTRYTVHVKGPQAVDKVQDIMIKYFRFK